MKLCLELRKHKRALVFTGGSGEQLQYTGADIAKWNNMVSQFINIAKSCGVMAVRGQKQYTPMKLAPDRTHFADEIENRKLMVAMLDDGVNALYAARPQGTFAYAQRLPKQTSVWGS